MLVSTSRRTRGGYSLVEVLFVLTLLAVGAGAFASTARRLADRIAVVTAREELIRAIARARALGIESGASAVTVIARPPAVRIWADGVSVVDRPFNEGSLTSELTAGRDSIRLLFDHLGIGRFANGTVTFRRGDASAGVVVSSYGRVRRR